MCESTAALESVQTQPSRPRSYMILGYTALGENALVLETALIILSDSMAPLFFYSSLEKMGRVYSPAL